MRPITGSGVSAPTQQRASTSALGDREKLGQHLVKAVGRVVDHAHVLGRRQPPDHRRQTCENPISSHTAGPWPVVGRLRRNKRRKNGYRWADPRQMITGLAGFDLIQKRAFRRLVFPQRQQGLRIFNTFLVTRMSLSAASHDSGDLWMERAPVIQ